MIVRHGVQFHWTNPGYRDFADFLATFNHDKRKKVKQERRKASPRPALRSAGIRGRDISAAQWKFFYDCYERTYHEHHSTPYLSLDFFLRVGPDDAGSSAAGRRRARGPPAVRGARRVRRRRRCGVATGERRQYVPGLHFEACYYQAIEFCIERGIKRFEGGAQGVHKLARGLMPVTTYSAHAIADPDFAAAIAEFCARERVDVAHAVDELEAASPFKDG